MLALPRELRVEIQPRSRLDIVNLSEHPACEGELAGFPQALYWSYHTTAGFLDQRVASHLDQRQSGIVSYLGAFQAMFPRDAGYRHDDLHLRQELSDAQRSVEPRNADAHLTFMAAGLRTCVKLRSTVRASRSTSWISTGSAATATAGGSRACSAFTPRR